MMQREAGALGRGIRLFDVYSGPKLPEGRVSLAFSLELGADDFVSEPGSMPLGACLRLVLLAAGHVPGPILGEK